MIVLAGGDLVLPDRILSNGSLVVDGARIAAVEARSRVDAAGATIIAVDDCWVVPGFIDVHVHGVEGYDTLDPGDPIAAMAARFPRYGVTAFCPTTVACAPDRLRMVLAQVTRARTARPVESARVLPAHLESNFINPAYAGAQPLDCLRVPRSAGTGGAAPPSHGEFSGRDILDVIDAARADVGIVTLAPELPGGIELVRDLVSAGHQVSLGHSEASFDETLAAIDAGARRATHLFNRMAPLTHRAPGVAGAVLSRDDVAAELICDGHHVHPAVGRMAIAAKGVGRIMAITDGTGGAGLATGSTARLGDRRIHVTDAAAVLDDGTLAGSTVTMDRVFGTIVAAFGLSPVEAAALCATTPARELRLTGFGVLARDCAADIVVLNRRFEVVRTFIEGREVYAGG